MSKQAVILLSGGMDSMVVAGLAREAGYRLLALTVDYNQRHRVELEAAARIAAICLGNPILLTQPRHGAAPCTRDVVAADSDSMTVNYSCPGLGRGRTTIRFETPRLVQIDSQGLDHGMPFALRAEARRVGPCA